MACVAMSQIVKQTIRVRRGNCGRPVSAATGPVGKSPLAKMRLLMVRCSSLRSAGSLAGSGNVQDSKSPRYSFVFMPKRSRLRQRAAISRWRDFPLPLRRSFTIPRSRYGPKSQACASGRSAREAKAIGRNVPPNETVPAKFTEICVLFMKTLERLVTFHN